MDDYLAHKKSTDAALVFSNKIGLDQSLFYIIGNSVLRIIGKFLLKISINCTCRVKNKQTKGLDTDRSEIQLSRVLTKNYSTASRVPMGIWGLVYDPRI